DSVCLHSTTMKSSFQSSSS
ncbi:pyruvate formate lyase family protein, partial [Vibrio parahaemolyticus V-223/04]